MQFEYRGLRYEWDDDKAKLVQQLHDVTMQEAASVFFDGHALMYEDLRHYDERRLYAIGMSNQARLLTVCWTERGEIIRIITAFKSTKPQQQRYKNGY